MQGPHPPPSAHVQFYPTAIQKVAGRAGKASAGGGTKLDSSSKHKQGLVGRRRGQGHGLEEEEEEEEEGKEEHAGVSEGSNNNNNSSWRYVLRLETYSCSSTAAASGLKSKSSTMYDVATQDDDEGRHDDRAEDQNVRNGWERGHS